MIEELAKPVFEALAVTSVLEVEGAVIPVNALLSSDGLPIYDNENRLILV